MAVHDTIGDFLTSIRNASRAGREEVETPASRVRKAIAEILEREGFISGVEEREVKPGIRNLVLRMKYVNGAPALAGIKRVSRPGCRRYCKHDEIPTVLGGIGISILTTPQGVIHQRDARRQKVGGEILCEVW
jgi:small subunit ribosomal protein S8